MRVLRIFFRAIVHGLLGKIVTAVLTVDVIANFTERRVRNARRISSHVGDETNGAFVTELDAFVKLLRQHHRPLHREPELARSFLLQFRRNERRNRIAFALLRGYVVNDKRLLLRFSDDLIGLCLLADDDLVLLQLLIEATSFDSLLVDFEQARIERWRQFRAQIGSDRPILSLNKLLDFALALNYHSQRHGLHATGTQTPANRPAQQRRYFVTH